MSCAIFLSLHAREVLRPRGPVLVGILGREVPAVPLLLRNAVLLEQVGKDGDALLISVLELGAVLDNSGHHRDGALLSGPDVASLDGARESVAGYTDADGDVGLETEALLADLRVPGKKIMSREVVELFDDGAAGLAGLGEEGCSAYKVY